jgi:hypothetical protein
MAELKPTVSLVDAMRDPKLFGKTFVAPSFWTWRTVAKLIDGAPLTEPRELELFKQCTGLEYNRQHRRKVRRLILLAGRRAGKDRFLSAVAVWRAALCADWRKHQSAGEGAVVILLGADKKQASILRRYCEGLLRVPLLKAEVTRSTGEVTEFRNGASLEISANDARLVRGRSAIAILGSECNHWKTNEYSASSDEEVVAAAEPSLSMCPDGGLLMLGSSVYRRAGYMFRQYKKLHGHVDAPADSLCWFAPSKVMNPLLRQSVVDTALAEDAPRARAEYLNVWREDIADVYPSDAIDASTPRGVYELPPEPGVKYTAFADCAGGTGQDSFALAIAKRDTATRGSELVAIRERKPRFVPAQVIGELAQLLKAYGISEVQGDRYAVGFHSDEWKQNGIRFIECERTTSENYLSLLPLLLAGRVRLLDNVTLRNQLTSLERRVGASDRETVSHPQIASAHDDVACAAGGALVLAASRPGYDAVKVADNLLRLYGTWESALGNMPLVVGL